ncbi:MAG: hypothetical protein ACKO13_00780 [Cytophagales bacterium]
MKHFDLIDDYLTNRLGDDDKTAFEKELLQNSALQKEVAIQRWAIEGVKKARAAELKTMLNNVSVDNSEHMEWISTLKMAASVAGAGLMVAGLLYYSNKHENLNPTNLSTSIEKSIKPRIEGMSPPEKFEGSAEAEKDKSSPDYQGQVSVSHIAVTTDATKQKYSFHYQFAQGKLYLYGDFEKETFKLLEFNGDVHALFIHYNEAYYLLDEKQTHITKLEPIKDKTLISKLSEYQDH